MPLITEGKTKQIFSLPHTPNVHVVSKNDITAGDGKKHDLIVGKAKLATDTTCHVFRLLGRHGLPIAFNRRVDDITFEAPRCEMFPYEVVSRIEAHGSALKRDPALTKGHRFPEVVVEFFLKTRGRKWLNYDLPCDDPLIHFVWNENRDMVLRVELFLPDKPIAEQTPFLTLGPIEVFLTKNEEQHLKEMERISKEAFLIVEKAWANIGRKLVDWKIEFGRDNKGRVRIADVIDNDSWRVLEDGQYIDKQAYRDGEGINEVTAKYLKVAELTGTDPFLLT